MKTTTRSALALFTILLFAGCGDIDSKPGEPVPNGGPGTVPNVMTNNGTNNGTNSENNIIVANNSTTGNNGTTVNNPANANNLSMCEDDAPTVPGGFQSVPSFSTGQISTISQNEMTIMSGDGPQQVTFNVVGLDLTTYFSSEEMVTLAANNTPSGVEEAVLGTESGVFYAFETSREQTVTTPELTMAFGLQSAQATLGQAQTSEVCGVDTECGLAPSTRSSHTVEISTGEDSGSVNPGVLTSIGPLEFYVTQASSEVTDPTALPECASSGTTTAFISLYGARTL